MLELMMTHPTYTKSKQVFRKEVCLAQHYIRFTTDGSAILASVYFANEASETVQKQLNEVKSWLWNWNIMVYATKPAHVIFSMKTGDYPNVNLNQTTIPKCTSAKYLGMHLDRRLIWQQHIKTECAQLEIKTRKMYWLLGPKSKLSLKNKVILYKIILNPIWSYEIQICGCASKLVV